MLKIEEENKMEKNLRDSIKLKIEECEKLEQEVKKLEQELKKLKVEAKVIECNKLQEDLINMQKDHLDKNGLGLQTGECSNQNDKE